MAFFSFLFFFSFFLSHGASLLQLNTSLPRGTSLCCVYRESGLVLSSSGTCFFNQQFCCNYKKLDILPNLQGLGLEEESYVKCRTITPIF